MAIVAIVQPVKVPAETEPRFVPDRPVPLFSVPVRLIEVHLAIVPVDSSFTWAEPEMLMAPPGLTDQVVAVVAPAVVAVRLTASAAAPPLSRILVRRLRMWASSSSFDVREL